AGEGISLTKDEMNKLKEKLEQAMKELPKFKEMKDQVQLTVTGEGLRVELLETAKGMFFESGKANPTETGKELLSSLATEMGKLSNSIVIEGHTDAKPFSNGGAYTNWELSTDRANAARRFMEEHGLRLDQVKQVRGFADQQLRDPKDPENATNRRVSVIVRYLAAPPAANGGNEAGHTEKPAHQQEPARRPAADRAVRPT